MATLTREQYLQALRKKANEINTDRETAISFYHKIGVLTATGKVSKNYKHVPTQVNPKPLKPQNK